MKEKEEPLTPWGNFTYIVFGAALVCGFVVFEGWALATLWNWFIPGIFTALPKLTTLNGIAMVLVGDLICKDTVVDLREFGVKFKTAYVKRSILRVAFALAAGAALKLLMIGIL